MGFFRQLGRMVTGQPAVRTPDVTATAQVESVNDGTRNEQGLKVIPEIHLERLQSHVQNETHVEIEVWLTNASEQPVRIDYIELLRQRQVLTHELAPGQAHQFMIYRGDVPRDEAEHHARLVFRWVSNTDQFEQHYRIRYKLEGTMHLIEELIEDAPARDI